MLACARHSGIGEVAKENKTKKKKKPAFFNALLLTI